MAEIYKGFVKWFNDAKGFGFIEHESGKDVFVHYSVIESDGFKTLKDGEEVAYELKEGEKGLHAARVSRTNAPERSSSEQTEAERDGYVAPHLETGTVPTEIRTASQMIEVDEIVTSSRHDDNADDSEADVDDASSEQIRTV